MTSTRECAESTAETVVDDLWRAGWFIRTAKALCSGHTTLDPHDVAAEAVITAMRAVESWRPHNDDPIVKWVKFRARGAMLYEIRKHFRINAPLIPETLTMSTGDDIHLIDYVTTSPSAEDVVLEMTWADIRDEIESAITTLTDKQQDVAKSRMLDATQRAEGRKPARGHWPATQKRLRKQLNHLAWMVQG